MKCSSLFHFYRAYYGGVSQGKVHFARAIIEMGKQLDQIFQEQDMRTGLQYIDSARGFRLTQGFLRKFNELAAQHYGSQLFREVQWLHNRITISKQEVGKRELYIPFSFGYAKEDSRLIFLEYGNLGNKSQWLPIFKTLVENFTIEKPLPVVEHVTYWDVMKGTTAELSYPDSSLAPKQRVTQTARILVEQAIGRRK